MKIDPLDVIMHCLGIVIGTAALAMTLAIFVLLLICIYKLFLWL